MKYKLLSSLFGAALACSALGQQLTWQNPGQFVCPPFLPPNIDAYSFVNNGEFVINFTNTVWLLPPYQAPAPYEMQNVQNFTNGFGAFLSVNTGMRVNNFDPNVGIRKAMQSFWNDGTMNIGTVDTSNTIFFEGAGGFLGVAFSGSLASRFELLSTNITSHGNIHMGFESLCTLSGDSINLDRGLIDMETNGVTIDNSQAFINGLIADNYWGLGTNGGPIAPYGPFNPATFFNVIPPFTPPHIVTNRLYQVNIANQLGGTNFTAYLSNLPDDGTSNGWIRAVFINQTNANVQANIYFPIGATVIEFTNTLGTSPNNLYLIDSFAYQDFYQLVINGFAGSFTRPTFIPFNMFFFSVAVNTFFFGAPASPLIIPPNTFPFGNFTNQYTAYQGLIQPNSVVIGDNFGETYSNSPGRIEITATNYLSLAQSRISSLNFLRLEATNQFGGSPGAVIGSPYSDFSLRSTNGFMQITNLTVPSLSRDEGTCSIYSCRFTNVVTGFLAANGFVETNHYHVMFVDARLTALAPTRIVNLKLTCTNTLGGPDNLIISDTLNVISNSFILDCSRLTITSNTNDPSAPSPYGGFNLNDPGIFWSTSTPRLQYFTNNGIISAPNTVFFRGSRTSPYYSSNYNEPYFTFVNNGYVTNYSSLIYATNFLNTGIFAASYGSIELHQGVGSIMTNGIWSAPGSAGAITIETGSLYASNQVLNANAALTLTVTNTLDDGSLVPGNAFGVTNKNNWTAGNGFNLLLPTANASLLGTTISNTALPYRLVLNQWSAPDHGASPAAFGNDAGVGRVILDGGVGCAYEFRNTGAANAMYVDQLELRDFVATNVDRLGNFLSITCDPGMTVYFGQALANGRSIAEKLPLVNNGRFIWVSNYNKGFWSSTNVVYPDGTTNRLNTALVTSCDIDSNGNGIPNCMDPAPIPILTPASLSLSVIVTNHPALSAVVSWTAFPYTTNYLYSATSAHSTNWQLVTNFIFNNPVPTRVNVTDLIKTNVPKFYRVRAGTP